MHTKYETSFTVFPNDTNYNDPPCIFGGKMLAEMDNCAAMTTRRVLYGTPATDAVTVSVQCDFSRPAHIGEIVYLTGYVEHLGNKSVHVRVVAIRETKTGEKDRMAEAMFVFVARRNGIPHVHGLDNKALNLMD
jgi:acyl-CoA hydrolase